MTIDYEDGSAFIEALQRGDRLQISLFIHKWAQEGTINDQFAGGTALTYATLEEDVETVKLLLEFGASTEIRTLSKDTALILACFNANTEIANILLEHGADPNTVNQQYYTPLRFAAIHPDNDFELMSTLIAKGAHIEYVYEDDGHTLLYDLIYQDRWNQAEILLDNGAKITDDILEYAENVRHTETKLVLNELLDHYMPSKDVEYER